MPQTASQAKRHPISQEAFDLYLQLQARWPKTFSLNQPKPLQIGIHEAIGAEMTVTEPMMNQLMRWYTRRRPYLQAMLSGTHRYGLDGEPVVDISELDRQSARARLDGYRVRAQPPRQLVEPEPGPASLPGQKVKTRRLWDEILSHKGELPMTTEINATLKIILREKPEMGESEDGSTLYSTLRNVAKGLPAGAELPEAPLYLAIPKKMWTKAEKRGQEIEAAGKPVLWMIEGAVGIGVDGLLVYAKGVQAIEGKAKGHKGSGLLSHRSVGKRVLPVVYGAQLGA